MAKISRTQYGTDGDDEMLGTALDDTIYGGAGEDYIAGGDGNDRLYGGLDTDFLSGGKGNDSLFGGDGIDILAGGAGNNILAGGYDMDLFLLRIDSTLFFGSGHFEPNSVDTIVDYVPGVDKFFIGVLSLVSDGPANLPESAFVSGYGAVAHDADDRLIYDRSTGNLYWDDNGNAPGGSVLIAKLLGAPNLQYTDIYAFNVTAQT
ncbi:calcium-binding protein [Undibacterium flavidum]|nr:hypothetical protein [Undibacterium flavidum]